VKLVKENGAAVMLHIILWLMECRVCKRSSTKSMAASLSVIAAAVRKIASAFVVTVSRENP
jgi:hypothetical protein